MPLLSIHKKASSCENLKEALSGFFGTSPVHLSLFSVLVYLATSLSYSLHLYYINVQLNISKIIRPEIPTAYKVEFVYTVIVAMRAEKYLIHDFRMF